MSEETISVRIASHKKIALDALAKQIDRDLSFVIEEALNAYLELHAWQIKHIEEGVRQADAGEFASEAEVREAFARWRQGLSGTKQALGAPSSSLCRPRA